MTLVSEDAYRHTAEKTCPFIFVCFRTAFRAMLEKRNSDSESDWDSLSEAPPLQTSCQTGTEDEPYRPAARQTGLEVPPFKDQCYSKAFVRVPVYRQVLVQRPCPFIDQTGTKGMPLQIRCQTGTEAPPFKDQC